PWPRKEFEEKLREKGKGYHIYHPFHVMMYEGKLSKEQLQSWVRNRFYYQISIPLKDAAILSNCPVQEIRKEWIVRILDHDGEGDAEGGIEAWINLGKAVGLKREEVTSLEGVSPGVRFAVDAYINFAKQRIWQESVCSSLTELFAPHIHQQRISSWPDMYPWIDESGLSYFKKTYSHIPIFEGLDSNFVRLTFLEAKGSIKSTIAPGLFFVATTIDVLSLPDGSIS
ncbi:pyrroloquinoline-quinone synthase PqqC, partial [bacterium]|nr:pyrroloquinoline-quinone synthase PqqC [bacterium]